ncbi:MAG: GTPase domain-containing protein [Planctomycetota bacterium]
MAARKGKKEAKEPRLGAEGKEELRRFCAAFHTLTPFPGTAVEASLKEDLRELRLILEAKVVFEVEGDFGPPLIVVVTGGTNVGKSEIFNALIATPVALPDPRAGMTRHPAVFAHASQDPRLTSSHFLPGAAKEVLQERNRLNAEARGGELNAFLHLHEKEVWRDLAVIDSPDIDSNREGNQAWALRLAAVADVILFVTSPSKYNDEVCVAFLQKALTMGKRIFVAFNLLDDKRARILEDFKTSVWKPNASGPPRIIELPVVPGTVGKGIAEPLKKVKRDVLQDAKNPGPVKGETTAAAFTHFAGRAREIVEVLRREARAVEAVREHLADEIANMKLAYRRRLESQEFLELEAVFHEVLKTFRVPILDDVLSAPSAALGWLKGKFLGGGSVASLEAKIQTRRGSNMQWIKEHVEGIRLGQLTKLSEGGEGGIPSVLCSRLKDGGYDRPPHAEVERQIREGEGEIENWVRTTRDEIVAAIEGRPYLKQILRSVRAVLQVGTGILVASLTGGIGTVDLVLAPAGYLGAKLLLEKFGSAYFNDKRRQFTELQLAKCEGIADAVVMAPFLAVLPGIPEGMDLGSVEESLASLERRLSP